jgi:class 3 adenylate cyclase
MNVDAAACRMSPGFGSGSNGSLGGQAGLGSPLPRGTVTFAFTDIEESTLLLRRLGNRYADVLAEHRRIIRATFGAAEGIEVDRQGDAFFFAFPRAHDAVEAAVDVQRTHRRTAWPDSIAVRVRIGLHTGEPSIGDEGYLGIDVVRAARICKAARGGQVLLSETTQALVGSTMADGVSVLPVGDWHLKDMDGPERIYKLAIDGIETTEAGESGGPRVGIPADWEKEIAERFGKAGTLLAANLSERVTNSLEATRHPAAPKTANDENLEHLTTRAIHKLEDKLRSSASVAFKSASASHALKAAHLSPPRIA